MVEQTAEIKPVAERENIPRDYNKIGVVHFKLFRTDGISLESQQMAEELGKLGKEVHFLSEDVPQSVSDNGRGLRLPDLSYQRGWPAELKDRMFGEFEAIAGEEDKILSEIQFRSDRLYELLKDYIDSKGLGVVHVRNIFGLPLNIPATKALYRLMAEKQDVAFIIHNADHIWEGREAKYKTPYASIQKLKDELFPPKVEGENRQYVVINSRAREALRSRGITAHLITDSFNFGRPRIDALSKEGKEKIRKMREMFGFADTDIVLGQMTRVINRKTIERTIQMAALMNKYIQSDEFINVMDRYKGPILMYNGTLSKDSRVKVFIPQDEDIQDHKEYARQVEDYARKRGVDIVWGEGRVKYYPDDPSTIQFYDAYSILNLNAFTPELEGFGNQFLESLWARVLSVVYQYPVFKEDIMTASDGGFKNLDFIDLGDKATPYDSTGKKLSLINELVVWRRAKEAIMRLADPEGYKVTAEKNYEIGKANWDVSKAALLFSQVLDSAVSEIKPLNN